MSTLPRSPRRCGQKLENKGVPEHCGDVILLLYDAYGYGEAEDARKALLKAHDYDWFHSVFWAEILFGQTQRIVSCRAGAHRVRDMISCRDFAISLTARRPRIILSGGIASRKDLRNRFPVRNLTFPQIR